MERLFYKLEAHNDGRQPIVGRLFDVNGREISGFSEIKPVENYTAELEFCRLRSDKNLNDALFGIESRLFISESLLPLFNGLPSAEVSFQKLRMHKKYFVLLPKEIVLLNTRRRKAKDKLGMEMTVWDVDASSFAGRSSCFYDYYVEWVVDDEFKKQCEDVDCRALEFKPINTF